MINHKTLAIDGFSLSLNMIRRVFSIALAAVVTAIALPLAAQPASRVSFNEGWTFTKDGVSKVVDLPHDWGVDSPFDIKYPGETGKLAWWGKAEYVKTLTVPVVRQAHQPVAEPVEAAEGPVHYFLDIDGAMSWSKVYCNGNLVTEWPYGYASFRADLTPYLKEGDNEIKVTLDNPEESSRWYPGGGIYRNVWLTTASAVSVDHWGTYMTTKGDKATLRVCLRNIGEPSAYCRPPK